MAIAKIKKIEVIGLQEDKDKFLNLLQQLGIVEVMTIQEQPSYEVSAPLVSESDMLEIEEALSYLSSFQEKSGFLKGMVNLKPIVYQEQLKDIIANFDYKGLLKELSDLRVQFKNLIQHKERLDQERRLLIPWRKFSVALDQIHSTQNCGILLGVFYRRDCPKMLEDFKKENINLFFEIVNQDDVNIYIAFLYIQEDFERLEAVLKNYHFNFVTLSRHECTAEERLFEINREIFIFDDQIQDIKSKILDLSRQQFKLMVVYDYLRNIKRKQEADKNLAKQQYTFSLSGWIRYKDLQRLEQAVADKMKDSAIFISDPKADEEIPVDLENVRIIQPFEFITKIYGVPKYSELDPTPYLAPFFFLYFGFCVSDVGYGFILASISWFALKKFKMGPQGLRFFRLFLFCGISTMIIGALTGSWFGNMLELLGEANKIFLPVKKLKNSIVILNPINDPIKLLEIALTLGIIQVWFGNIVAAIGNIKNKRYLDVILDQVTMLTFLFGLTRFVLMFFNMLDKDHILRFLDKIPINLYNPTALLGVVTIILTQGRSEKGLGSKLFYGVYNFYSALSGYLSDILSYSRLWALGLVTGVMASTINLISIQFSQILVTTIPFLDRIFFIKVVVSSLVLIVIFIAGHIVSFLMNLLGAFVHPVRLQFVEFFSKFFKTSGKSFKPFKIETKYINIS